MNDDEIQVKGDLSLTSLYSEPPKTYMVISNNDNLTMFNAEIARSCIDQDPYARAIVLLLDHIANYIDSEHCECGATG